MIRLMLLTCLFFLPCGCMEGEKSKPEQRTHDKPPDEKERAKMETTRARLVELTRACEQYKLQFGEWPQSLEMLTQPQDGVGPFVKPEALRDSGNTPFMYDPIGHHHKGQKPDIWTLDLGLEPIGNWPAK